MKNITISKKDIRNNKKYKEVLELLERGKVNYKWLVNGTVTYGSDWERSYNIRKSQEYWNERDNYINKVANIYNERQNVIFNELLDTVLQLLAENIAMKKALKEAKISIYLTD